MWCNVLTSQKVRKLLFPHHLQLAHVILGKLLRHMMYVWRLNTQGLAVAVSVSSPTLLSFRTLPSHISLNNYYLPPFKRKVFRFLLDWLFFFLSLQLLSLSSLQLLSLSSPLYISFKARPRWGLQLTGVFDIYENKKQWCSGWFIYFLIRLSALLFSLPESLAASDDRETKFFEIWWYAF